MVGQAWTMRSPSEVVAVVGGERTTCDYGRFIW